MCASVVWAGATYTVRGLTDQTRKFDTTRVHIPQFSSALFFYDAMTVHLAAAASTIFVLYGLYALEGQHLGTPVLQSTVLQVGPLVLSACLTTSHWD